MNNYKDIYLKYYNKQMNNINHGFDIDNFCKELGFIIDRDVWLDIDMAGILNIKDKFIQANYFEGKLNQNFTIAHLLFRYLSLPNKNINADIVLFSFCKSQATSQRSEIRYSECSKINEMNNIVRRIKLKLKKLILKR